MDSNELRALADALERMAQLERHGSPGALALESTVDYLRAQADAQPVAWRCEVRDLLTQAEQCLSTAVRFEQWAHDEPPSYLSAWDYEADHIAAEIRAVLAAAPAAPQAEPIDPHMIVAEDRFPDEPAEPKREPLSDDEISKLAWKQNLWTDGMIEFSFVALAREVERAHGIGGSDAE